MSGLGKAWVATDVVLALAFLLAVRQGFQYSSWCRGPFNPDDLACRRLEMYEAWAIWLAVAALAVNLAFVVALLVSRARARR